MFDQLLDDAKQVKDFAVLIYKDKEGKICLKGYVDPANSVHEDTVKKLISMVYDSVVSG